MTEAAGVVESPPRAGPPDRRRGGWATQNIRYEQPASMPAVRFSGP